jgi:hypothetical protein
VRRGFSGGCRGAQAPLSRNFHLRVNALEDECVSACKL